MNLIHESMPAVGLLGKMTEQRPVALIPRQGVRAEIPVPDRVVGGADDDLEALVADAQPRLALEELARLAAQVQLCHHLPAQHPQRLLLRRRRVARHAVDDAQRAERLALRSDQGRAGVKANVRIARDERIVCKALVLGRVGHDEQVRLGDDVRAEGELTRRFADAPADLRFEPLPMVIDERDERDGGCADLCRERRQIVQRLIRGRVEQAVLPQRVQTPCFIDGSKRRFHADVQPTSAASYGPADSGMHYMIADSEAGRAKN